MVAQLIAKVSNMFAGRGSRLAKPDDFMLGESRRAKPQSLAEMHAKFSGFVDAHNAKAAKRA